MASTASINANFPENDVSNDQRWQDFVEAWLKHHNLPPANNAVETAEWHGFTSLGFSQVDRIAARVKLLEHINSCHEGKIRTSKLTSSEITDVVREVVEECKSMADFMNEGKYVENLSEPSRSPYMEAPAEHCSMKISNFIKLSSSSAKAKDMFGPRSSTLLYLVPNSNHEKGSVFSRHNVPRRLNLSTLKNLSDIAYQRSLKALHMPLTSIPHRSNTIQNHRATCPQTANPRLTAQLRLSPTDISQEDITKRRNRFVVFTPPADIPLPRSGLYSALPSSFFSPGKEALRGTFWYPQIQGGY
jgi:hypothetical protein